MGEQIAPQSGRRYSHCVLGVLVLVSVFNFIDRNILSILAEDIKADLGITDGPMGFCRSRMSRLCYRHHYGVGDVHRGALSGSPRTTKSRVSASMHSPGARLAWDIDG